MRLAPLLLTLAFALGALSPCAFARLDRVDLGGAASAHAHHATRVGAPPCHAAASAAVKAPCPCGREKRAPATVSLGSLGVAVLAQPAELPPPARAIPGVRALPAFASAPASPIEKVPRAA